MTADSGTPSRTMPSTIASATSPARAAGSMLLWPSPPIRSMIVSPTKKVATPAKKPSAGAPDHPPASVKASSASS